MGSPGSPGASPYRGSRPIRFGPATLRLGSAKRRSHDYPLAASFSVSNCKTGVLARHPRDMRAGTPALHSRVQLLFSGVSASRQRRRTQNPWQKGEEIIIFAAKNHCSSIDMHNGSSGGWFSSLLAVLNKSTGLQRSKTQG
jgi:hypothetical protein